MSGLRASETDIRDMIRQALEAKQEKIKENIGYEEALKHFFPSQGLHLSLENTDEWDSVNKPAWGYWRTCGKSEEELQQILSTRISGRKKYWQDQQEQFDSTVQSLAAQNLTHLAELFEVIRQGDCLQFIIDGLKSMLKPLYNDENNRNTEGYITKLEADYLNGARVREYKIAKYLTHIQDTKNWLSGQYIPKGMSAIQADQQGAELVEGDPKEGTDDEIEILIPKYLIEWKDSEPRSWPRLVRKPAFKDEIKAIIKSEGLRGRTQVAGFYWKRYCSVLSKKGAEDSFKKEFSKWYKGNNWKGMFSE